MPGQLSQRNYHSLVGAQRASASGANGQVISGQTGARGRGQAQKEKPHTEKEQSVLKSLPLDAQFALSGRRLVPDYPCPCVALSFDVVGNHLAWRISLKATVKVPGPKKSHVAELEFSQGVKNQVVDFQYYRETNEDDGTKGIAPGFVIEWNTGGGVGCNVQIPQDNFDDEAQQCLDCLERFALNPDAPDNSYPSIHTIRLRVITLYLNQDELKQLEAILESLKAEKKAVFPLFAYLDETGRPRCDFEEMPSVEKLKAVNHGWTKFSAKDFFAGPLEAHVRLAYGSKQEHEFEVEKRKQEERQANERRNQRRTRNDQVDEQDADEEIHFKPVPDHRVKRQLLALARLCDSSNNALARRFRPVLLNREPTRIMKVDPTEFLGLDDEKLEEAMQTVINAFEWSPEQEDALAMTRALTGYLSLLRGPPGSGKTKVLVGMAAFYCLIGIHVILFTPSKSAAENLTQTLRDFLGALRRPSDSQPVSANPIGLYYGSSDYEQIRKEGNVNGMTLSETEIVVSTLDHDLIDPLFDQFGASSKGIIIIHDDANFEQECDTWLSIFGLENREKVQGIILGGDASEWHTDMRSRHSHLNAFSAQVSLSLFDRLFHRNFPTATLRQQHRMRRQLSRLPILRQYHDSLINAPNTSTRVVDARFSKFFRSWLGTPENRSDGELAVTLVNVSRGEGKRDFRSKSKYNMENVATVMDFCIRIGTGGHFDPTQITILSPYRGQVDLYKRAIQLEMVKHNLPESRFPIPCTVDGFRGKENKIVILDLVLSSSADKFEIGMTSDEYRAILATTRARDFLMIVVNMSFNEDVLVDETTRNFMSRHGYAVDDFESDDEEVDPSKPKPIPYFNNYANLLKGEGKVYEKNVPVPPNYVMVSRRQSRNPYSSGTWVRQDWRRADVVSGVQYANAPHERNERARDVVPFSGHQSLIDGQRGRRRER